MDLNGLILKVSGFLLIVVGAVLAFTDVVSVSMGNVEPNRHMPFIPAIALAGIGLCIVVALRPSDRKDRALKNVSYFHPNNHPRGRIDALDGTSD